MLDLSLDYGPARDEVIALIEALPGLRWLDPWPDDVECILEALVAEHITALQHYAPAMEMYSLRVVRSESDRAAARAAAWDAAWDAARAAAWDAAGDAAWAAAWAAAWDAAGDAEHAWQVSRLREIIEGGRDA